MTILLTWTTISCAVRWDEAKIPASSASVPAIDCLTLAADQDGVTLWSQAPFALAECLKYNKHSIFPPDTLQDRRFLASELRYLYALPK